MANSLRTLLLASLAALLFGTTPMFADGARFDLTGPKVEVRVTRDGVTLPIAEVPNLQPGDKLWLHADFPETQSVKYLLVVAFLRGTTNPPPENWFTRIETWNRQVRDEGTFVTVPAEAQQVMLFLAPETGGDFSTLRSAVKGRPGVFVRASQDLNQAGFEQARIEKYLQSMRTIPANDIKSLQEHSTLLSQTLALKPNDGCFKPPVDQQYACLTQSGNQILLDDGHGQTVADSLSNGASSDLINAASYTQLAGAGLYSAYVGAIVDVVRLTSSLHTAQYQYIPAIAFPDREQLNLHLNAPPSFHNPKSVIVIGLPAVQAATPPPLQASDPKHITCMLQPKLVFGLDGAPLVYSTGFAHNLVLHLNQPGPSTNIPLTPDAFQGGLVPAPKPERELLSLDQSSSASAPPISREPTGDGHPLPQPKLPTPEAAKATLEAAQLTGTLQGMWGFDPFTGPTIPLQKVPGKGWRLVSTDPLIAGQDNHLTLASSGTACIDEITSDAPQKSGATEAAAKPAKLVFKTGEKPNEIALTLPIKVPAPEAVHLSIKQFGDSSADIVTAKALSEPAKIEAFTFHSGDSTATLTGTSLAQVKQLELNGVLFTPSSPQPSGSSESSAKSSSDLDNHLELALDPASKAAAATKLNPGEKFNASITLKDGRILTLPTTVDRPRPVVTLLSKSVDEPKNSPIHLAPDDLPLADKFTFFLKSAADFPRAEQIEIASPDDSLRTMLSISNGTLILQNRRTVLATLDPLKLFGTSAFGPLRLRAVAPDGTAGDWIPLVTLVRLPNLTELRCPVRPRQQPCTLSGSDLYLVDSFSTDQAFTAPTSVPEGFIGNSLVIPHPSDAGFYLRLRDDPTASEQVTLPVLPQVGGPAIVTPAAAPAQDPAQQPGDPIPVLAPAPAATQPPPPAAPAVPAPSTTPPPPAKTDAPSN